MAVLGELNVVLDALARPLLLSLGQGQRSGEAQRARVTRGTISPREGRKVFKKET
jgi:hypothetical protein